MATSREVQNEPATIGNFEIAFMDYDPSEDDYFPSGTYPKQGRYFQGTLKEAYDHARALFYSSRGTWCGVVIFVQDNGRRMEVAKYFL